MWTNHTAVLHADINIIVLSTLISKFALQIVRLWVRLNIYINNNYGVPQLYFTLFTNWNKKWNKKYLNDIFIFYWRNCGI